MIRGGVLDIKRLRQIDADGLELWEPVFKAGFSLSRSDLAAASTVWALPLETLVPTENAIRVRVPSETGSIAELAGVRCRSSYHALRSKKGIGRHAQ